MYKFWAGFGMAVAISTVLYIITLVITTILVN